MNPTLLPSNYRPSYCTQQGLAYCGDALTLLAALPDNSINLVMTSPPFALQRQKEYGNKEQHEYLSWLAKFAQLVKLKLKDDGSFVLDIGGAYQKGFPIRSLYNFRVPIYFCDELGFFLAQDFYWFNPAKLPSPIEWVNKRKCRTKDAVNTVWWFSKSEFPKADVSQVLVEYSARMKKLIDRPETYYNPKKRPSGHEISSKFAQDNGGAIPSNLLQIPNTDSNGQYLSTCKAFGLDGHPARFPSQLPEFFIRFLTEPNDIVLDIFAGSNTTGAVAEVEKRQWLAFELQKEYVATSVFRFMPKSMPLDKQKQIYEQIMRDSCIDLTEEQSRGTSLTLW